LTLNGRSAFPLERMGVAAMPSRAPVKGWEFWAWVWVWFWRGRTCARVEERETRVRRRTEGEREKCMLAGWVRWMGRCIVV
jgi:hypothetical protein